MVFADASLQPGVELVAEAVGLGDAVEGASLVITGEGAFDGQSVQGKTPVGVARIARGRGVPVVVLAGVLGEGYEAAFGQGVTAAFSICDGPMTSEIAISEASELIAMAAENAVRLWAAGNPS